MAKFGNLADQKLIGVQQTLIDELASQRDGLKNEATRIKDAKIATKKEVKAAFDNGILAIQKKPQQRVAVQPAPKKLETRVSADYLPGQKQA